MKSAFLSDVLTSGTDFTFAILTIFEVAAIAIAVITLLLLASVLMASLGTRRNAYMERRLQSTQMPERAHRSEAVTAPTTRPVLPSLFIPGNSKMMDFRADPANPATA